MKLSEECDCRASFVLVKPLSPSLRNNMFFVLGLMANYFKSWMLVASTYVNF